MHARIPACAWGVCVWDVRARVCPCIWGACVYVCAPKLHIETMNPSTKNRKKQNDKHTKGTIYKELSASVEAGRSARDPELVTWRLLAYWDHSSHKMDRRRIDR